MKNQRRLLRSTLRAFGQLSVAAFAATLMLALPVAVNAQETSSAVSGVVTDDGGAPVAGVTVTIRDESTGLSRSAVTNASGQYTIRNLPVGYGYTMGVAGEGFAAERRDGVAINLGRTSTEDFALRGGTIEEIVTIGTRQSIAAVAVGPSSSFGLEALEAAPTVNRNITDVLRADPRIYVDESRGDINAVQCAGKNSRYNSLTVDGVRMNDSFGLNSNGYPTERMPFSYDAIEQVSIELAPFDVIYGGFSACNINAVTKSGSNEWSGGAFVDYTSDNFRADSLEGDSIEGGSFDETRYGFTLGGPIVKDKLFFFLAAESLDGANLFDRGAIGSGAVNEVDVTQQELDDIYNIANQIYNYDPGFIPSSKDHTDEKLLVKLDWNISDTQRLAFTYNFNDGENFTQSDSAQDEIEFSNHLYERGAELNAYVATLYSDWTDRFSTELRVGYLELDNRQISVGGTDFGEMRIDTGAVDVYIGGDDSRQSNKLDYDVTTIALRGTYDLDNQSLTFGYELESLNIFNLFMQHTETEIRFSSIADFQAGLADRVYYNNNPETHNPSDAAADWGYDVHTVYIQDEFMVGDNLTLIAGIRHDWYTTSDEPALNQDFLADYGFGNNLTLDGEGLTQPRLGFTLDMDADTTMHGGIGIYSGGNPNVWLSNMYSNDNTRQIGARIDDVDLFAETYVDCETGVPTGPGWCIPSTVHDLVTNRVGGNFEINYLDPNFKIPSEVKLSLGFTHLTRNDWTVGVDFLYSEQNDAAMIKHGDLEQIGTNPDGYPIYDSVRMPSFRLTNSSQSPKSTTYSFGIEKQWDNFYFRAGYAYTNAKDVQPMTSSVAFSNYQNRAFFDPEEDVISTSNYEIKHRASFAARWTKEFGNDMDLSISLYGHSNSGRPFSYTFNGTIDPYGFTPYLDFRDNVLEPGDKRNENTGSGWRKLDARIALDFPGFQPDHRASAFLIIDNLTNLLNDDWGVLYQHNFPRTVVRGTQESRIGDASRYEIRMGLKYDF